MKLRLLLPLIVCGTLLGRLAGQAEPDQPPSGLNGRIEGDTYVSPTGVFKMKIPVLPELGGEVTDTPNVATFYDDINLHISVGAFALARDQKWEFETRGIKDYLTYFFGNFIMPDFKTRFPGAEVETASFLPKFQEGALHLCVLLPGGSSFMRMAGLRSDEAPVVAKRGFICFVKNSHFFVISTELAERVLERSTYKNTPEQEEVILRHRLQDLIGKITFLNPPETPK
ncbi:MAG: hypothetical protein A3G75_00230 [Verrucomicrobia bacterium RIFCSPLOWO2_12_FULL_64_8]|nr:MAG: hypothetical protein A3G75_00230 [Verrucomicrobia bacterium RIFCSPLOWO2_12_FULL_64_8]